MDEKWAENWKADRTSDVDLDDGTRALLDGLSAKALNVAEASFDFLFDEDGELTDDLDRAPASPEAFGQWIVEQTQKEPPESVADEVAHLLARLFEERPR